MAALLVAALLGACAGADSRPSGRDIAAELDSLGSARVGPWLVTQVRHPMTDAIQRVEAMTQVSPGTSYTSAFGVTCEADTLRLTVAIAGAAYYAPIRWRLDTLPPESSLWSDQESDRGVVVEGVTERLIRLTAARRLTVQAEGPVPGDGPSAVFEIDSLAEAVAPVTASCKGRQSAQHREYMRAADSVRMVTVRASDESLAAAKRAFQEALHETRAFESQVKKLVADGVHPFVGWKERRVMYSVFCKWRGVPPGQRVLIESEESGDKMGYRMASDRECGIE